MTLDKRNMRKIALLLAFGIALYLGLQNIYRLSEVFNFIVGIFQPLILGMAIAFILNVLMRLIENKFFGPLNRRFKKRWPKARRPLSILLTFIVILGVIALIALIFIPELIRTITNLTTKLPPFFANLQEQISEIKSNYPIIGKYFDNININWENVGRYLAQYGQKLVSTLVGSTVTVATSAAYAVVSFILGVVFAINILSQKEKLKLQLKKIFYAYLPLKKAAAIIRLCKITDRAFSNFIVGQCTEACILGTLSFIGMTIFQFPYASVIAILVAFNALIPIFGSFLSILVGALLISVVNPILSLWYILFFVILQQIEGNLIYPRVVGSKVGLPPLWVLAAITIGGSTFGLVGMIVNIPIFSVFYSLLRENVSKKLSEKKLFIDREASSEGIKASSLKN